MSIQDKHLLVKIGQYALIANDDGKVLLLQRARSKKWSLPGGRLDKDERDWKKAFIREIKEEIGLEILEAEPFDIKIIEDQWQVKYCVFFRCKVDDLVELKLSQEHAGHRWVGKEEISNLDIEDEPSIREVVDRSLT